MARGGRKRKAAPTGLDKPFQNSSARRRQVAARASELWRRYRSATNCALAENPEQAAAELEKLRPSCQGDARLLARVVNDLAAIAALQGDYATAVDGFRQALALDSTLASTRVNLEFILPKLRGPLGHATDTTAFSQAPAPASAPPLRVAIVSFLFNWPSTAGGIIHTVELTKFLSRAGYETRHFYFRNEPWRIGAVADPLPIDSHALEFAERDWMLLEIQARLRTAVDSFAPDFVLITDAWNMKPRLAASLAGYPVILRQQALECLCPLNNLRLLADDSRTLRQCPADQLSSPLTCQRCLGERGARSGALHQWERELAGVGSAEYDACLRQSLRDAHAVLALNPEIARLLEPHATNVQVVTWGMDANRFPWPWSREPTELRTAERQQIFMAGLIEESIKGFDVLHAACARLWRTRQDFELVATGTSAGRVDEFTRFVGWLSQDDLPRYLRAAEIVAMPTIAQEGLARSTVEAMGVGRPVVASRIGGVPYTIEDGVNGLLCEPGDADDFAVKLGYLLDHPELRNKLGRAGRQRFEREFTWEAVIERYYRPLFAGSQCRSNR